MRNRTLADILAVVAALQVMGCTARMERVTLEANGAQIIAEVARTEEQRAHGFMGRKGIGPRDGMLFVFSADEHLSFWMRDTPTALSIAFLSSEGKVTEIRDMEPFSEKVVRSRLSCRYALEMRKGAFADLGIREGDIIRLPDSVR